MTAFQNANKQLFQTFKTQTNSHTNLDQIVCHSNSKISKSDVNVFLSPTMIQLFRLGIASKTHF